MRRALLIALAAALALVAAFVAYVVIKNQPLAPTAQDVLVIEHALVLLEDEQAWSREDDRNCESDTPRLSLYCALRRASIDVTGAFHHRAAALQAVRRAIDAMYPADYAHRLQDFNNSPDITLDDVRAVLHRARADLKDEELVTRALEFRLLLQRENQAAARAMMTEHPRRWWEAREGEGAAWTVDAGEPGPWAAWDDEFRSRKVVLRWTQTDGSATAVIRETNDYFQMLDRGRVTNEITYFFDVSGRIDGLLIRAAGDRDPGRTDEFLAWAQNNDPAELDALMPAGEVDPSGDHPRRFRRLLARWRDTLEVQIPGPDSAPRGN